MLDVLALFVCFLKYLYGQQSFCSSVGSSIMSKKVFKEKKLDSDILTP